MLFLALFWSLLAGVLELLLLASGYVLAAATLYLLMTTGIFYLGKVSVGDVN